MRNMEYIFRSAAENKNIELDLICDIQNKIAFFDLLKINQIELNLIGNALKYTHSGGKVTYLVKQTAYSGGYATYRCSVKDTGIGMSKEFCKHIFDAFERENNNYVSATEGAGLGLAIVKRLVDELGGNIECRSEKGKGSEFICTFTFKVGSEADIEQEEPIDAKSLNIVGKRVLLIEDNALNREISREILENDGFEVEEAFDGETAVDMIKNSKPGYYDIVLMDIQMPKLNGCEATRKIRALGNESLSDIPIIAVTANAFEEDKHAALSAGMDAHIAKPINVNELNKAILRLLGKERNNKTNENMQKIKRDGGLGHIPVL